MKIKTSALVFGIIAAACAVLAQVYGLVRPPQAYGVCIVCHARDMINTIFSQFSWYGAPVSTAALKGLMLTTVGILLGAFTVSLINGEFKIRFVENKFFAPVCGFIVMCAGLVLSACPMRLLLRTAYGDIGALGSVCTLVLGIFCATKLLQRRSRRKHLKASNKEGENSSLSA